MIYKERLFLRKRNYELNAFGVQVHDIGLFRSTFRFYKYEEIGNHINFEKGNILIPIVFSVLISFLTYFLCIVFRDLAEIIVIIYLLIFFTYLFTMIQTSTYKGVVYFSDVNRNLKKEFFLQTNYPLNSQAQNFIDDLRKRKIDFQYEKMISSKRHFNLVQKNYLADLNGLKTLLNLDEIEYDELEKRLYSFFEENEIAEVYNDDGRNEKYS